MGITHWLKNQLMPEMLITETVTVKVDPNMTAYVNAWHAMGNGGMFKKCRWCQTAKSAPHSDVCDDCHKVLMTQMFKAKKTGT